MNFQWISLKNVHILSSLKVIFIDFSLLIHTSVADLGCLTRFRLSGRDLLVIMSSFSCIDRHVEKGLGDKIAYYWVGNDPKDKGQVRE